MARGKQFWAAYFQRNLSGHDPIQDKSLQTKNYILKVGVNHENSLSRAKKLIKSAASNGADCVKLQTYTPDTMTIKSDQEDFKIEGGLWDGYNLWDLYEMAHTPFEWQKELFEYAKKYNASKMYCGWIKVYL